MPIRVDCSCGQRYQVADEHAGKRLKCKSCQAVLAIPTPGRAKTSPVAAQPAPQSVAKAAAAHPPVDAWYIDSHDGNHYGPVPRAELDQWVEQGLVSAACQIRREGEPAVAAVELYPQLAEQADEPTDDDSGYGGEESGDDEYQPILRATGKNKSMANMAIGSELKQLPGAKLVSSLIYQVGADRSMLDRLKAGTIIGPYQESGIRIDSLQVFRCQDSLGEFAAIVPYDNGMIVPIEFVARMRGVVPHSLVLLKQSGGKIAMEAGAVMGGPLGALLGKLGTKVESVWAGCDASLPPIAETLQASTTLRDGIQWEGKIGGGPVSTIYRIDWGVQALPLDDESFLLVAKSAPKQKMFGLELGIGWFGSYRRSFAQFLASQPPTTPGEMDCYDPGIWFACCIEALRWLEW